MKYIAKMMLYAFSLTAIISLSTVFIQYTVGERIADNLCQQISVLVSSDNCLREEYVVEVEDLIEGYEYQYPFLDFDGENMLTVSESESSPVTVRANGSYIHTLASHVPQGTLITVSVRVPVRFSTVNLYGGKSVIYMAESSQQVFGIERYRDQ